MNEQIMKVVLTPKDVAELLQISRNNTYELFHRKDFPSFRVGKQLRVKADKFLDWLDCQGQTA